MNYENLIKHAQKENLLAFRQQLHDHFHGQMETAYQEIKKEVAKSLICNESAEKGDGDEYEKFFQSKLKKYGVESPEDIPDDKKDDFFDEIDRDWKGDKEVNEANDKKLKGMISSLAKGMDLKNTKSNDYKEMYSRLSKLTNDQLIGIRDINSLSSIVNRILFEDRGVEFELTEAASGSLKDAMNVRTIFLNKGYTVDQAIQATLKKYPKIKKAWEKKGNQRKSLETAFKDITSKDKVSQAAAVGVIAALLDGALKEELSPTEKKKKEEVVISIKDDPKSLQGFKDRYGKDWKSVMYATATKTAKNV